MVGHRGYGRDTSSGYPENTVESCLAAADAGLPWIEIDTQRTADDQLVLDTIGPRPTTPHRRPHRHRTNPPGDRAACRRTRRGPAEIGIDIDVKTALPTRRTRRRGDGRAGRGGAEPESKRRRPRLTSFNPGLVMGLRPDLPGVVFGLLTWLIFRRSSASPRGGGGLGLDVIGLNTRLAAAGGLLRPRPVPPP